MDCSIYEVFSWRRHHLEAWFVQPGNRLHSGRELRRWLEPEGPRWSKWRQIVNRLPPYLHWHTVALEKSEAGSCSPESEYIVLSTVMRSLVHVRALLSELCTNFDLEYGDKISTISTVFEDNRAVKILATTKPPHLTPLSKSLAVWYHWFRWHIRIEDGKGIQIVDVASKLNKADFLTKSMAGEPYQFNRKAVNGW